MDYFIHKTLLFTAVSVSVVTIGFLIADLALREVLRLRKRVLLYFGVGVVIHGIMPVGIQFLKNEEWRIVKLSADYHDTINYYRNLRNETEQMKEKQCVADTLQMSDKLTRQAVR